MSSTVITTRKAILESGVVRARLNYSHYIAEAGLLGTFMLSAAAFSTLFEHPASPVQTFIASAFIRRAWIGAFMGLTAVGLIYSPWGKRSGAHMNPAFTLSSLRLGHIDRWDATMYILAQFVGGAAGMLIAGIVGRAWIGHPSIRWVSTEPGTYGIAAAWVGEFVISFMLMGVVLAVNRFPRAARRTGLFAGALVATFITFEAPLSGMSMNPARTMASCIFAGTWNHLWIYSTAPVAGMLLAVEIHRWTAIHPHLLCVRLHHHPHRHAIFRCNCPSNHASNH
jgi:aquaporin Z